MDLSLSSAIVVLLLVVDPIGNIPVAVTLLRRVDPARRTRVVARECAIALAVLLVFVFAGEALLRLFGLTGTSLNIAGGVILFLIAIKMVFRSGEIFGQLPEGEPFIVRSRSVDRRGTAIATVVVLASSAAAVAGVDDRGVSPSRCRSWCSLRGSHRAALGERTLAALERLMGWC
jgi:small neutral amino acid transporter SnatA (MarC family)